jgi:hypothetical protein
MPSEKLPNTSRAGRRLAVVLASAALTLGCGRHSAIPGETPGTTGGRAGGGTGAGGAPDPAMVPMVDPAVSAQWTWHPCGTLAAAPPDVAAVTSPDGHSVAVLDETRAVRVHDLASPTAPRPVGSADFAVYGPDGTLYLASSADPPILELQPVGGAAPALTFSGGSGAPCGSHGGAFSADGSLFLVHGGGGPSVPDGRTCVWRVADGVLVAALDEGEVLRDGTVVGLTCQGGFRVSIHDFSGAEISSVPLEKGGACPLGARLSPRGDRVAAAASDPAGWASESDVGAIVWNADTGARLVTVTTGDRATMAGAVFTPSGDRVLVGDGIFAAMDGTRLGPARLPRDSTATLALAPDAGTVVVLQPLSEGRASLLSVPDGHPIEMLGPPPLAHSEEERNISALALSGDGKLLVVEPFRGSAFVLQLGTRIEDAAILWPMFTSIGLNADISASGTFASISGDVRQLYRVADGALIWDTMPPPTLIEVYGCTGTQLRLSPTGRWAAGTGYMNSLDVFAVASGTPWQRIAALPTGCQDTAAFSRDEKLMATSTPALYRTGELQEDWKPVWAKTPSPLSGTLEGLSQWGNEVRFSPDETKLLVSHCDMWTCDATLYAVADGAPVQELPALTAPHPSFSPEGHWVIAGGVLQHLPSGATRSLDASGKTTVAIFAPNGDIIAGAKDESVTRYCRDP